MPEQEQYRKTTTPHSDGKRENVINDSTATQGTQMGIQFESKKEFNEEPNPFHLTQLQPDEGMKEFEKLMKDNKVD